MGWIKARPVHQCFTPRGFNVWIHRAQEGASWECPLCLQRWTLHYFDPDVRVVDITQGFVWRKDPASVPRPDVFDIFGGGEH